MSLDKYERKLLLDWCTETYSTSMRWTFSSEKIGLGDVVGHLYSHREMIQRKCSAHARNAHDVEGHYKWKLKASHHLCLVIPIVKTKAYVCVTHAKFRMKTGTAVIA